MTSTTNTKVMIADDHTIVRDGLQEVLERAGGFDVVGHAGDGQQAVEMAQTLKPDVIIMDVMMPVKDGIDACREIREELPGTRVLMLTAATEEDAVIDAVAAGATGYLQKYSGRDKLISTVRDVVEGEFRIPSEVVKRVFEGIRSTLVRSNPPAPNQLTAREQAILSLFARGKSYSEIAEISGRSPLTIRNAIYGIQNKLGAKSKQDLVVWAVRSGLLDDTPDLG